MRKRSEIKAAKVATAAEGWTPVWERHMNPEQLDVIRHQDGPCAVLAQAGSGKTRAVVHRIARMVAEGVPARAILAVTFSKKAADEMNARLATLGVAGARVGTWHSLCLQILKEGGTEWSEWEVDEKDRAAYVLKDVLGYKHLDWKQADAGAVSKYVTLCKANLFDPMSDGAIALAEEQFGGREARLACEAYELYQRLLEERAMLTFDDFLRFAHRHLSSEVERVAWAARWRYVIQDEAQDENLAQKTIFEMLCRDHRNGMKVGDTAQSIYGFRGSSPEYLANFERDWTGARVIIMSRNYRSGDAIVAAANEIIRPAAIRLPTDMVPMRGVVGKVAVTPSANLDAEGEHFAAWVTEIVRDGGKYSDCTALFRTNAQSRALEESLLARKIPYVVVGGTSFYERKEVKDLLGYLRVAAGRDASGDAVKRSINAPFRYLGSAFVERLVDEVAKGDHTWSDVPALVEAVCARAGVQSRQRASANDWVALVCDVGRDLASEDPAVRSPRAILDELVSRTRYIEWLEKEEGGESLENSRGSNVRELIRVADRFATVGDLLDYIDKTVRAARKQREDKQAGGERVLLMSVHRSKGLEWPHVFVSGCNEDILPHRMGEPEEERRLMYVAATRARDSLVLSYVVELATRAGIKAAVPSRFLSGLQHLVEAPAAPPPAAPEQGVLLQ